MKVYSNLTGQPIKEDTNLAELMATQAKSPVYWQETIENMISDGINVFVEIGPGKTLSGLVKKVNHDAIAVNVEDIESLNETIEILKGGSQC